MAESPRAYRAGVFVLMVTMEITAKNVYPESTEVRFVYLFVKELKLYIVFRSL